MKKNKNFIILNINYFNDILFNCIINKKNIYFYEIYFYYK